MASVGPPCRDDGGFSFGRGFRERNFQYEPNRHVKLNK